MQLPSMDIAHLVGVVAVALTTPLSAAAPPAIAARGAGYARTSWSVQEGLPSAAVTAIAQDGDGYLWLGSFAGLVRFDGVRFLPWNSLGNPALPETVVHALVAARDGGLWVGFGNRGGVGRIVNGALRVYGPRDGLPEATVVALAEDHEGAIWAGGLNGLARFRHNRWEQIGPQYGLSEGTTVDSLYVDEQGDLFVASSAGVFHWEAGEQMKLIAPPGPNQVVALTKDRAGSIWITGPGLAFSRLDAHSSNSPRVPWGTVNGSRLLRDHKNQLWVATQGHGLLQVVGEQWTGQPAVQRFTTQQGLTNNRVISLFEDKEGNIWVGTSGGLNRFTPYDTVSPVSNLEEFGGRSVQVVARSNDGGVWVGTTDGLVHRTGDKSLWYTERHGLPSAMIRALYVDGSGTVFVSTSQGPAVQLADGRFAPLRLPGGLQLTRISAMTKDLQGGLWLCDFEGIYLWQHGALTKITKGVTTKRNTPSVAMTDNQGRVWIGFAGGGLVVYGQDSFTSYSEADGLSRDTVVAIHQDSKKRIWIATHHGLSRFEGGHFTTLLQGRGLPGNRLMSVLEDTEGYIWFGTDIGYIRINPEEFEKAVTNSSYRMSYRTIDVSDGAEGTPITRGTPNSAHVGSALWFATTSGITVLDPHSLRDYPSPAPPRIERIIANDHALFAAGVRLPARTTRVEIDYTSLTFSDASRVRFRYMLEGNDNDWVYTGDRRQAFYTNLAPATYRFRVAARIGDAAWVEALAPWDFSIQAYFYQTRWFYLACAVLAATAAWSGWRYRMRQIRREYSLVITERTRLAREIHDTLLQGMAGVALQLHHIVRAIESQPEAAKQRCERARDSLEGYMRETRYAIWHLRSPLVEGIDLRTALRNTADEIIAGTSLICTVRETGKPFRCAPRVEDHVVRIGREAIRNVARHAHATHVCVDLNYEFPSLFLRIQDDGSGFDPNSLARDKQVHYGLDSMREHAELIGGQFCLTTHIGEGTHIEVRFPAAGDVAIDRSRASNFTIPTG
jgi:signal transduction histidine kinase/ligand-binding sensor domain-containing protein